MPRDWSLVEQGATFSPCRRYRYTLLRRWNDRPLCAFIGLNPSTADESADDPTVRRCQRFAAEWGYGGLLMLNAFGFRSTDPAGLRLIGDPIGPGNNAALCRAAAQASVVVCAWGVHGRLQGRGVEVCTLLADIPLYHLGVTRDGAPRHPLYLRSNLKPQRWSIHDLDLR